MNLVMRKTAFCICKNKDADQLHSKCAADRRLCFRYTDNTTPLLPKSEISSLKPSDPFVSDLVGYPEDRFSQDAAHMVSTLCT